MATIEKLLIKGIRSFNPDNDRSVEFRKPLTLIVGHNGAGKTTVIECLKQATTGSMPPNCKNGQSFIHDPDIAGSTEVKAQIKLRLQTSSHDKVIVTRAFMLTQQRTRKQFKSLEGSIQRLDTNTNEFTLTSNKCAEVDSLVPSIMGVSRAILEHVVFVHQEESLWPFSEGKQLKEKFDSIFASTKYTQALVKMKEMIKEKNQTIKTCKLEAEHLKTHSDAAKRLRATIRRDTGAKESLTREKSTLEGQARSIRKEVKSLESVVETHKDTHHALQRAEATVLARQDAAAKLRHELTEEACAECDATTREGLATQIEQTRDKRMHREETSATQRQKGADTEQEIATLRHQVEHQTSAVARAEAAVQTQTDRLKQAHTQVHALSAELSIPASGLITTSKLPPAERHDFQRRVHALLKEKDDTLSALRASNRAAAQAKQQALSDVTSRLHNFDSNVRSERQAQAADREKANRLRAAALALPLPAKLQREREVLRSDQESLEARNYGSEIQMLASKLADTERSRGELRQRILDLRAKRDSAALASQAVVRLRLAEEQLEDLRQQASSITVQHSSALRQALDDADEIVEEGMNSEAVSNACQRLQHAADRRVTKAQSEYDGVSKRLVKAELNQQTIQQQLTQATGESARLAEAIMGSVHEAVSWLESTEAEDAAEAALAQLQTTIGDENCPPAHKHSFVQGAVTKRQHEMQEDGEDVRAASKYGAKWATHAREHNACKVCQRPFGSPAEQKAFVKRFEQSQINMEQQLSEIREDLAAASAVVAKLQKRSGEALRHKQIQSEIPQLQSQLTNNEDELATLRSQSSKCQEDLKRAKEARATAIELRQAFAVPLKALQDRINQAEAHRDECQRRAGNVNAGEQSRIGSDLSRAEAEADELDERKTDLSNKKARLTSEEAQQRRRLMESENALVRLQAKVDERSQLEQQAQALDESAAAHDHTLRTLQTSHEPLQAQKNALAEQIRTLQRQHEASEATAQHERDELQRRCSSLDSLFGAIADFERAGSTVDHVQQRQELDRLQSELRNAERSLERVRAKAQKKLTEAKELEDLERQLKQFLDLKDAEEAVATAQAEVERLKAAAGNVDVQSTQTTLKARQKAVHDLELRVSTISGQLSNLQQHLKETEEEAKREQYQDVDARYRQQQVELRTLEIGNRDVESYCKGLEKALLTYHTNKMQTINQSLKELWQKTYRGRDIDYIEIKAEMADSGRSSYSYRVVMYVSGAEVDMRGRCSAGQKVLACILIRMALAESFCVSCGVIALDEPTTNLDVANAAALADALRSVLDLRSTYTRQTQRDFQLIVITHDENFATRLGTKEFTDSMTRIHKDEENYSTLEQVEVD